ncbi:MAG: DUF2786 domain-containing protein [Candidatus Electrothrix aestuarii]|uniref:DUF2786 domain-containing protein n=1 Tax=Candidatus Electrothrix aestuarii TaxID=3062594 RepID=A0AAU8LRF8_9BACT|nr:DUF2786 domain-containing protein [Candidatus Electrothrix aestuarii]
MNERGKGKGRKEERCTEAVRRAWLEQLRHEFKTICFQYRVQLRSPIFELSAARQQLGCWIPEQRVIRISEELISNSSWDVVLMVLKHEMAHQVCSEVLGISQAGHGPEFQEACQLLGVPEPYNRATGDLPEILKEPSSNAPTEAGRKIIQRVNKLLALAGSENEHEAALAMQRATELLHRHNLHILHTASQEQSAACVRLTIRTGKKQVASWQRAICRILTDYFFVEVIFSSLYDAQRRDNYKTIELLGRSENVPVAEHCYYFLLQQLESLWQRNRQKWQGGNRNTRTAKNSYYLGLLHGFAQKLAEQRASQHADNLRQMSEGENMGQGEMNEALGTLCVQEDNQVQAFVGFHFPRLQTRSVRSLRIHQQPYEEALITGKKIILHQSLAEKKGQEQSLLISR